MRCFNAGRYTLSRLGTGVVAVPYLIVAAASLAESKQHEASAGQTLFSELKCLKGPSRTTQRKSVQPIIVSCHMAFDRSIALGIESGLLLLQRNVCVSARLQCCTLRSTKRPFGRFITLSGNVAELASLSTIFSIHDRQQTRCLRPTNF